jgi:plastocyanin
MRTRTLALLAGSLSLLAACGGSTYGGGTSNIPTDPMTTPVLAATVNVQNNFFDPATVDLAAGGTVTWNWIGSGHSVTSVGSPALPSSTGVVTKDAGFSLGPVVFASAGTYQYYCTVHGTGGVYGGGNMTGAIFVR